MKRKIAFFFLIFTITASHSSIAQLRTIHQDIQGNDIEKISFYSPNEGYVAFFNWIGYTTDSGRNYKQISIPHNYIYQGNPTSIIYDFNIKGVKAFNKDTLVVYGDFGLVPAIVRSVDGGNSFQLVFYSQYDPLQLSTGITDIVFPQNGYTGYAVDADRILKSTDKGANWQVVYTSPNSCFDYLIAADDNVVLALSDYYTGDIVFPNNRNFTNNKIVKTINGGIDWQQLVVPDGFIETSFFLTPLKGWLCIGNSDQQSLIYYTVDGGSFWRAINDPSLYPF